MQYDVDILMTIFHCYLQTPGAQCVLWNRANRTHTVGAVFVPPSGLGHLLLLHLEGSEIHRKGKTLEQKCVQNKSQCRVLAFKTNFLLTHRQCT